MQVQVARKPSISSGTGNRGGSGSSIQSSQKLILKAVADADKSIAKKRRETRQKNVELDTIHMNRMKATIAARKFKSGQQDEDIDTNTSPPPMRKVRFPYLYHYMSGLLELAYKWGGRSKVGGQKDGI